MKKQYIGDSVYFDFDGYQIVLTTENGFGPSNTIYMEPSVFENLLRCAEKVWGVKITVEKKKEGAE